MPQWHFVAEPQWVGYFKLSCFKGYECIQKPKSGHLRGWQSEAKAFLALRLILFPVAVLSPCLCRFRTCSKVLISSSFTVCLSPTEIIRAERVNVRDVSSNAATLQWRPVLSGLTGFYEVRFGPLPTGGVGGGGGGSGTGTSPSTGGSQYQRLVQPADSSTARLTGLKPDTTYIATLTPESNEQSFNALSVTFTTKPGGVTSSHTLCLTHKYFDILAFNFGWFYEKNQKTHWFQALRFQNVLLWSVVFLL